MKTQAEMMEQLLDRADADGDFRAHLVAEPKKAIKEELGISVAEWFRIVVHENGANVGHLVLPPAGRLSDAELGAVAAAGPNWNNNTFP